MSKVNIFTEISEIVSHPELKAGLEQLFKLPSLQQSTIAKLQLQELKELTVFENHETRFRTAP